MNINCTPTDGSNPLACSGQYGAIIGGALSGTMSFNCKS